ncbi:shieldin complex subunit 3 [Thalassophryne amazonica]|uniref:shieldin complex subunit 3 n=1 Tax=Thalassophryne amazonica TaxID=390379 RepID=UPI001471C869|nr:shieldin complex subunit 3 [Thalassophryne amazonica]XP_034027245.1 shieldin complex subunit 3 [Thalassophryne amazonica]
MEDVFLHYQPGSADGLRALLETTEKLLEPFPCRPPSVFTPWSPSTADRHLPIRPARPPPIITTAIVQETEEQVQDQEESSGSGSAQHWFPHRTDTKCLSTQTLPSVKDGILTSASGRRCHTVSQHLPENREDGSTTDRRHDCPRAETRTTEELPKHKERFGLSESSDQLQPGRKIIRLSTDKEPHGNEEVLAAADSKVKRSWSIFRQKGVVLQSSQSPSKQFCHMVLTHRLHLRQRARWTVCQHHCGPTTDIEQVWQSLSRAVRRCRLPTCNAHVQRERAEIWVFCDVVYSEQVGRFLKEELQLSGRINLSVRNAGNVFSM